MDKVNPRRNFRAEPFNYPDIVQTSIGPMWLGFTENEPTDPPMVNVMDLHHWQGALNLPPMSVQANATEVHLSFAFVEGRWSTESQKDDTYTPTITIDGQQIPVPPALDAELGGYVADWARSNQERFVEHQQAQWRNFMKIDAGFLENNWEELPRVNEIDDLIHGTWARSVEPDQLALAQHVRTAVATMQDAIAAAREAFKPFMDFKDSDDEA
jgi:hypothetical protein